MNGTLIDAGAILMGPRVRTAGELFLRELDIETLRNAFRAMALRTHPDVAARNGGDPAAFAARFIQCFWAYERLLAYLNARGGDDPTQQARTTKPANPSRSRPPDGFYRGPLPQRQLRLGEFLYYSGLISWQSLISSVVWQRRGRPKFGEIARDFRVLTLEELVFVLQSRNGPEPTGEAASRLRLLTPQEVTAVLRRQRSLQKPIGKYFRERERMPEDEVSRLVVQLFRHNTRSKSQPQRPVSE